MHMSDSIVVRQGEENDEKKVEKVGEEEVDSSSKQVSIRQIVSSFFTF